MVQQEDASMACWSDQRFALVPGATPGDSTEMNTVPWSNGNDTWSTPRKRWFDSIRDHSCPGTQNTAKRLGLNPSVCGFDSRPGHKRLGRQPADHLGLEPGMLWVRVPPEPLGHEYALVEQPGVLACPSRRRSRVQIPSRALGDMPGRTASQSWPSGGAEKQAWHGTQIGKAAKLKPW